MSGGVHRGGGGGRGCVLQHARRKASSGMPTFPVTTRLSSVGGGGGALPTRAPVAWRERESPDVPISRDVWRGPPPIPRMREDENRGEPPGNLAFLARESCTGKAPRMRDT